MISFVPTIFLIGVATAQITTSFAYFKNGFGPNHIGFYGSVISVKDSQTALHLEPDNGTDPDLPGWLGNDSKQTFTIGPDMFEWRGQLGPSHVPDNITDELDIVQYCSLPKNAEPSCTQSAGAYNAYQLLCDSTQTSSTSFTTQTYTYSGRMSYSGGVETLTQTIVFGPNTKGFPDWCSNSSYTPTTGYQQPLSVKKEDIATYPLIITAGQEKLGATPGVGVSASGATPTSGGAGAGAGSASSGAAMPMRTVGPVIAGLGAAMAVFL
jgi:hypothetical protein